MWRTAARRTTARAQPAQRRVAQSAGVEGRRRSFARALWRGEAKCDAAGRSGRQASPFCGVGGERELLRCLWVSVLWAVGAKGNWRGGEEEGDGRWMEDEFFFFCPSFVSLSFLRSDIAISSARVEAQGALYSHSSLRQSHRTRQKEKEDKTTATQRNKFGTAARSKQMQPASKTTRVRARHCRPLRCSCCAALLPHTS